MPLPSGALWCLVPSVPGALWCPAVSCAWCCLLPCASASYSVQRCPPVPRAQNILLPQWQVSKYFCFKIFSYVSQVMQKLTDEFIWTKNRYQIKTYGQRRNESNDGLNFYSAQLLTVLTGQTLALLIITRRILKSKIENFSCNFLFSYGVSIHYVGTICKRWPICTLL